MIVKVNKSSLDFLMKQLSEKKPSLGSALNNLVKDYKVAFEIDDIQAYEIRDWIEEEIQKIGYDENYELNQEGKVLQELSDKFYE